MKSPSLNIALASQDGIVTGLSHRAQKHPLYGTDSYQLRMETELNPLELQFAEELRASSDYLQKIRWSIRSWAAQLGLAGFNPECTNIKLQGSVAVTTTLISDISNEQDGDILVKSLRKLADKNVARLSRVLLLPDAAFSGRVGMPLRQDVHYRFDRSKLSEDELEEIWRGKSGRQAIQDIRENLGKVPAEMDGGSYFVGTVEANPGNNCWVIEPRLVRGRQELPALHDQSCLFDPIRTNGERQVEVRIIGNSPESLANVSVLASVYHTNLELFNCNHTTGV